VNPIALHERLTTAQAEQIIRDGLRAQERSFDPDRFIAIWSAGGRLGAPLRRWRWNAEDSPLLAGGPRWVWISPCHGCGEPFVRNTSHPKRGQVYHFGGAQQCQVCRDRGAVDRRARARERRAIDRAERRADRYLVPRVARCLQCGRMMRLERWSKLVCSTRCRVRRWRAGLGRSTRGTVGAQSQAREREGAQSGGTVRPFA